MASTTIDHGEPDFPLQNNATVPNGAVETSHATLVCTPDGRRARPSVAFCVAGAARTFATQLIHDSYRAHYYEPLAGGEGEPARARFFVLLKTDDSAKMGMAVGEKAANDHFEQHHTDDQQLVRVLNASWMTPMLAEAVIVRGSGAHVWGAPVQTLGPGLSIASANASMWKSYAATFCSNATASMQASGDCCVPQGAFRDPQSAPGNEARLVHQALNQRWCYDAIGHHEYLQGWKFDLVAFSRPDLFWYGPLPPWCSWPWRTHMLSCFHPGCDMAWVAPRRYKFDRVMDQAKLRRDCRTKGLLHKSRWGVPQRRESISCCGPAEWLQWYSYTPNRPNATKADDIPVYQSTKLVPDRSAFGLLRQSKGACELSMHPHPGQHLFAHVNHMNGLSIPVGLMFRKLFGTNYQNISRCRKAVGPYRLPTAP